MLRGVVDQAARLRHPQLDPVMLEQRRHRRVLAAVKRPLLLPHHDRVPPPVRVRQLRDQRGGFWTAAPRHRPALADVEEGRHDYPMPADQRRCLLVLAGPATSPDPASPPSTPGRKTRTATRRAPVPCSPGRLTAPPTPPARPRPQPRQLHGSPPALPSRRPPPATQPPAATWYQAPRVLCLF